MGVPFTPPVSGPLGLLVPPHFGVCGRVPQRGARQGVGGCAHSKSAPGRCPGVSGENLFSCPLRRLGDLHVETEQLCVLTWNRFSSGWAGLLQWWFFPLGRRTHPTPCLAPRPHRVSAVCAWGGSILPATHATPCRKTRREGNVHGSDHEQNSAPRADNVIVGMAERGMTRHRPGD
jgi:hypothetical protein